MGDRLAVGLRTLTPPTQVRILVPQPYYRFQPKRITVSVLVPMIMVRQLSDLDWCQNGEIRQSHKE